MIPKLIASDVDGTFITSSERVTPRLRDVVLRATAAGSHFTLATGRPPRWLFPVLEQLPLRPICVCANGAVLYDSEADRVLHTRTLSPHVMREIVARVDEVLPVGVAVERAGQSAFDRCDELFLVSEGFVHAWESEEHGEADVDTVVSQPAIKMLLRNHTASAKEMYAAVRSVVPESIAHVTFSIGEGLLELSAPNVTKASGLEELGNILGVSAEDVIAFGDMANDIEMVRWAGTGVAMGNAIDALKQVADEVTTSNDDFGVARVLERIFPAD